MLQEVSLNKKKEQKIFSPKMVRELLNIDNEKIISLCKKISLVPKKNSKGQTYFSRDDVKILKRVQDLQAETMQRAMDKQKEILEQKQQQTYTTPPIQRQVPVPTPQIQTVVDAKLAKSAIDTIERLNNTLSVLEESLSKKLTSVLDEKLDGMDEVVVDLIRTKTENESLRHKLNELNKENFNLKNNLNAFKHVGFGFYTKKQYDMDDFSI